MKGVYNHSPELYERAMELRGRVSSKVAQRLTGVPATTIICWWRGGRPKFLYTETQRGVTPVRRKRRQMSEHEKARARRENNKRWYYRSSRRARYHPVYNPSPALAPLHHLWYRGVDILAFIDARYERSEVTPQLEKSSGEYGRWTRLLGGAEWLRLDAADRLFVRLGLVLSEMDVEPHYCRDPRFLPREETTVAA